MARTLLAAASVAWAVLGLAGLGIGLVGSSTLKGLLPPLAIDAPALGGAVVAVSVGVLAVGALHLALLVGLRAGHRLARTGAILLTATLGSLLAALAAAAATGAATVPERAPALLLAAVAAACGALGYGLVAALLVGEIRSGRAT